LVDLPEWNKQMAARSIARNLSVLLLVSFLNLFSGCEGSFGSHNLNCPISVGNRATNDILFVAIITAGSKNMFGFLDSTETGYNKTSLGCEVELVQCLS